MSAIDGLGRGFWGLETRGVQGGLSKLRQISRFVVHVGFIVRSLTIRTVVIFPA